MRKFPALASFRKPSPAMLNSSRLAAIPTLPDTTKAEASITLKRVAPVLKIDGTTYHVLDILIGLTQSQDWNGSNRPVVAISNERLADYTMRSERTIIRCLRKLVEAGILAYRDSATGRRFISRDENGKQKAAFGLDFSPARARMVELKAKATAYQDQLNAARDARLALSALLRTIEISASELAEAECKALSAELSSILGVDTGSIENRLELVQALYERTFLTTNHSVIHQAPLSCPGDTDVTPKYQTDNQHKDSSSQTSQRLDSKVGLSELVEGKAPPIVEQPAEALSMPLIARALKETKELLCCTLPDWRSLVEITPAMCRMISVSVSSWENACEKLGAVQSAVLLALVHEKACRGETDVRNPQGYFLSLADKMLHGKLYLQRSFYALAQS